MWMEEKYHKGKTREKGPSFFDTATVHHRFRILFALLSKDPKIVFKYLSTLICWE